VIDVSHGLEQTSLHHLKTPLLFAQSMGGTMDFVDRDIMCIDCGAEFEFSAGEQLFFHDKQFTHDPKRCKQCKKKHASGGPVRHETKTTCSACGESTTVPFKITQGRPVLCRPCFDAGRLQN
jgi:CxxC-x17-CxxC domain-containing protein